jgi:hypothetical protein
VTLIEQLRSSRESAAAAYHKFLLEYPKARDHAYSFFEGREDASFYTNFIARFISTEKIHGYRCGKKQDVYDVYTKINKREESPIHVLFFVDKDWSDLLEESNPIDSRIYVTDYYSVENYIAEKYVLNRIWAEIFHPPDNINVKWDEIESQFATLQVQFYDFLNVIMALIIYCKQSGMRPLYRNINLKDICSIEDNLRLTLSDESDYVPYLEKKCEIKIPNDYKERIASITSQIRSLEPKQYIRGKFDLWFFVTFLYKVSHLLEQAALIQGLKLHIYTNINDGNAIEILGPRVEIPDSLTTFLENNFINRKSAKKSSVFSWLKELLVAYRRREHSNN